MKSIISAAVVATVLSLGVVSTPASAHDGARGHRHGHQHHCRMVKKCHHRLFNRRCRLVRVCSR